MGRRGTCMEHEGIAATGLALVFDPIFLGCLLEKSPETIVLRLIRIERYPEIFHHRLSLIGNRSSDDGLGESLPDPLNRHLSTCHSQRLVERQPNWSTFDSSVPNTDG